MTPNQFLTSWLAARTLATMDMLLAAPDLHVRENQWAGFWLAYSPSSQPDMRPAAVRFVAEQHEAATAALGAATAASPSVRQAVARAHSQEYWLEVYGTVERAQVARRQARYLIAFWGPGWDVEPEWRTSTVMALAKDMVESEDFTTTPYLADALQDADCNDDEWLGLLRDPLQPWFAETRLLQTLM